jgi:D-alanyl-D-alanine carboxypeptidase (penicillin-binding protein 5/6)
MKALTVLLIFLFISQSAVVNANANESRPISEPQITARAAILVEVSTGKILYARNEHRHMAPASLTKLVTALVLLDYFQQSERIVVGNEINSTPFGSSIAHHAVGETLTVRNLLRALLIQSGNDSGTIAAQIVAERHTGESGLAYATAERIFCGLMNTKAKELGAYNTYFGNPHGFDAPDQHTTAYDMMMIGLAFMENDILRGIVGEGAFTGHGAGEESSGDVISRHYTWRTRNQLMLNGDYHYPYAVGMKTGFTNEAGDCLASYAIRDGMELLTIVMDSPSPARWLDTIRLFEYGFNHFDFFDIVEGGTELTEIALHRPKLGEPEAVKVYIKDSYTDFLRRDRAANLRFETEFDTNLLFSPGNNDRFTERETNEPELLLPIYEGEVIGKYVVYHGNEILFTTDLYVLENADARTSESDFIYYRAKYIGMIFSFRALPYWISAVFVVLLIIWLIGKRMKSKRNRMYTLRKRY